MRARAFGAIFGALVLAAGFAAADPWTDPAGRFTLDVPHGWRVEVEPQSTVSYVRISKGDRECQFVATPAPASAAQNAGAALSALKDDTQFTQVWWTTLANTMTPIFANNSAQFVSRSADASGFWPVQRAEFASPGPIGSPPVPVSAVHAGFTWRPGMQIKGFCYTVSDPDYPTADNPALFGPVLDSMGTPQDAQYRTDAEAYAAQQQAQQAAAQAAQQQQPQPHPHH